jgi:hypothetical protein
VLPNIGRSAIACDQSVITPPPSSLAFRGAPVPSFHPTRQSYRHRRPRSQSKAVPHRTDRADSPRLGDWRADRGKEQSSVLTLALRSSHPRRPVNEVIDRRELLGPAP